MSTNQTQPGGAPPNTSPGEDAGASRMTSIATLQHRLRTIEYIIEHEMEKGVDYDDLDGIKGVGNRASTKDERRQHGNQQNAKKKPKMILLQPGAQMIMVAFGWRPEIKVNREPQTGGHIRYFIETSIVEIETGAVVSAGVGECLSSEAKYAFRNGSRKCPNCDMEAIIKGKEEYGGGWLCFGAKGGCGTKFQDNDSRIVGQDTGKVANDNIADVFPTVLKMAAKRSLVHAILNGTAAARYFTQDEDMLDKLLDGIDLEGTEAADANYRANRGGNSKPSASPSNQSSGPVNKIGDRAAKMIKQFSDAGKATQQQLESYIRKPAELWTAKDIDAIRDTGIRMTKENISFAQATGANTPADPAADAAQLADLQLEASNLCLRFSNKTQAENILSDNGIMDHQAIAECKSVPTLQRAIAALQAALPPDGDDQLFSSGQQSGARAGGSHGAFA